MALMDTTFRPTRVGREGRRWIPCRCARRGSDCPSVRVRPWGAVPTAAQAVHDDADEAPRGVLLGTVVGGGQFPQAGGGELAGRDVAADATGTDVIVEQDADAVLCLGDVRLCCGRPEPARESCPARRRHTTSPRLPASRRRANGLHRRTPPPDIPPLRADACRPVHRAHRRRLRTASPSGERGCCSVAAASTV